MHVLTQKLLLAVLAAALLAVPGARAQYRDRYDRYDRGDRYENRYDRWHSDDDNGNQRNVAGQFDYYALVLSWSPTHCAEKQDDDQQCNRRDGRRFNFVLHGLWPQYERGYPEDCRTPRRPFVPQELIDNMLDIMPSSGLVIHEYRKHGTCSGLNADAYFGLARRLFRTIRIPEAYRNPYEPLFVEPGRLAADMLRANPQLKEENIAIACGGPGNRLKEIHFCFSKSGEPRACGSNEDQRRMCSANRMFLPPVRSTARDDTMSSPPPASQRSEQPINRSNPLPGPRTDTLRRGY